MTLMDGPRAVAAVTPPHFPWTHTNSQRAACQSASIDLAGEPQLLEGLAESSRPLPFPPMPFSPPVHGRLQRNYKHMLSKSHLVPQPRHRVIILIDGITVLRALLQLCYSSSPKGGTVALQFSYLSEPRGTG
ncbi:Hypothetical predicted protein [Scomber scombrus]|uniref:Uncharacterized protein n=1 Tax=Scomber scombrus TaxID=13677 RepID=A0AAV1MUI4_SCOSC